MGEKIIVGYVCLQLVRDGEKQTFGSEKVCVEVGASPMNLGYPKWDEDDPRWHYFWGRVHDALQLPPPNDRDDLTVTRDDVLQAYKDVHDEMNRESPDVTLGRCMGLDNLACVLNQIRTKCEREGKKMDDVVDMTSLPTFLFKHVEPEDTREIWSFDDQCLLVFKDSEGFVTVPREDD